MKCYVGFLLGETKVLIFHSAPQGTNGKIIVLLYSFTDLKF